MGTPSIWNPPALCGCQFVITADWGHNNGYHHPIPFTISEIELVKVCHEHKEIAAGSMPDVSRFYDDISEARFDEVKEYFSKKYPNIALPTRIQTRGYLRYPIKNPTPAQVLYTHFCFHHGQVHRLICGCQAYQHGDHEGVMVYKHHHVHAKKCHYHHNDSHDMQNAMIDHHEIMGNLHKNAIINSTDTPLTGG